MKRRDFVRLIADRGALVLAIYVGRSWRELDDTEADDALAPSPFEPNVWLSVEATGVVRIKSHKSEMGQGVWTYLPLLVAEELDVDWERVMIERAPVRSGFLDQNTGGSDSIQSSWLPLRRAGATARLMLLRAAAGRWGVPDGECQTSHGTVVHRPTKRRLMYRDLVADPSRLTLPAPESVTLKSPADFQLVGKSVRRRDTKSKVNGTAVFGIDVRTPGMLYASILHPPVLGGRVARVDDAAALSLPGVRRVVPIDPVGGRTQSAGGVAVVATSTWAAMQGCRALRVHWSDGPGSSFNTVDYSGELHRLLDQTGIAAISEGEVGSARAPGGQTVTAEYELPFLAQAALEPMNCTAHVRPDHVEIWAPTQYPTRAFSEVARLLGLSAAQIDFHVTFMGGGFGRRICCDYVTEAVQISRAVSAPVQLVWSREEDMQHSYYRPASVQRLRAMLGGDGRPTSYEARLVGPSTDAFWNPQTTKPQAQELWGARPPYDFPNVRVEYTHAPCPVPIGWWRSVADSQNVFCVESFANEIAHVARRDPVQFRLDMLGHRPRLRHVLELAVRKAGNAPRGGPDRRGRGVACSESDGTSVAEVVDLTVTRDGAVNVERVCCAVDCGQVVSPNAVTAQIEGSIGWALTAVLHSEITISAGRVVQSNFGDYPVLRMREMPRVDVSLVPSTEPPSGVGEPAVPPLAAAVCNAIFAATGVRVRRLPLRRDELKMT